MKQQCRAQKKPDPYMRRVQDKALRMMSAYGNPGRKEVLNEQKAAE